MMQTVYDPQGAPHTVESVDAREYLKSGYYTQEPATADAAPTTPATQIDEAAAPADKPRNKPGPKPKAPQDAEQ